MKWIGTQTIYDHIRLNKGITLDSVSITTIQSSGESFADNDTSLMTSAAVDDRINTVVTAEDLDLTADSGTAAVDLNSQALAVTGGTGTTTSATGQAVTVNVDATQSQITSLGSAGATTDIAAGDITMYNAVNDGNPTISMGKDVSDRLEISAVYHSGAQTYNWTRFTSYTTSSATNAGRFGFYVDEVLKFQIYDAGINIVGSNALLIGGVSILSDSSGSTTLNNIDALDATTIATMETAMEANIDTLGSLTSATSLAGSTGITSLGTLTGLTLDGDKDITPAKTSGSMIHLDTSTLTDSVTSADSSTASFASVVFEAPTLSADNSNVTITDAATLYINGAPAAGGEPANPTLTNTYALWVDDGLVKFDGNLEVDGTITGDVTGDVTGGVTGDVTGDVSGTAATVTAGTQAAITTCANLTTVGKLTGPVEIEQGASGGGSALLIDNDDTDKVALDIEAANVDNFIVRIKAPDLTTSNALHINADSLTTGSAINLDIDDALTTGATKELISINYDKAGDTASGQTSSTTGLDISLQDAATDNVGTITMIGVDVDIDSADADGTVSQIGVSASCIGGDAATSYGYKSHITDGGTDFTAYSSADTADYFSIATTANGATTLTTVDGGAAAAHFEVAADGDITLDAAGTIKLEGPVRPTGQIQMTSHNYKADQDTTETYVSLADADSEGTSTTNVDLPLTAPVVGKLLKIFLRSNKNLNTHDLTWRLRTISSGANFGSTPAIIGTQSGAGCQNSTMTTYDFTSSLDSGTNAIAAGDAVFLTLESDTDFEANVIYYITCLWEWDFSSIG